MSSPQNNDPNIEPTNEPSAQGPSPADKTVPDVPADSDKLTSDHLPKDQLPKDQLPGYELRASDIDRRYTATDPPLQAVPRPRVMLPLVLFLATCASTFWVGAADWKPLDHMQTSGDIWAALTGNWQQGLTYMCAVLAILLTHEMGHFIMTLRHKIPASYPLCIPVPINPIGTMGAVIGMDGLRANRREIFDIGLAGPLAGLAVAIPVLWFGVRQLDLSRPPLPNEIQLYNPVIVRWMIEWMHPQWAANASWVGISQLNAFFMAGWVGMLVTGLNMLPVSQLDGGHTIHGLFGKQSFKIARAFTVVSIIYVLLNLEQAAMWTLMLVLVIVMGIHHPPTADDSIELDDTRWIIGMASLSIPILCFPLLGLRT